MFEVGKTYRKRGGGTALINSIDNTTWPLNDAGGFCYRADGCYAGGGADPNDLLPGAIEDTPPAPVETLRDRFAMAAVTGMLAGTLADGSLFGANGPVDMAEVAGRIADACMAEREKPHG
jgi:hypothetical protein